MFEGYFLTTQTQAQARPRAGFTITPITSAYIALGMALIAVSFAAVTMRLALDAGMNAFVIAGFRLTLAGLFLTPFVLRYHRAEVRQIPRRALLWALFAGVLMGVNIMFIALSLQHTTIMVSQVIINTGPLWVALLEMIFLGARLPRAVYYAISLTMVGGGLIAFASTMTATGQGADGLLHAGQWLPILGVPATKQPLLGALLAVIGSVGGATYMVVGRNARQSLSNLPYIWIVFSTGGLFAFVVVALMGIPVLGYTHMAYFWVLVLTIVPHLIGHGGFNYALGFFPATMVSISGQSVTISSSVMAFLLFAELPTMLELLGSVIIAVGVLLALRAQRARRFKVETT